MWVAHGGALHIREVEVLFTDAEHAYIGEGLTAGDRVVATNLATVVDGLAIRDTAEPVGHDSKTDSPTASSAEDTDPAQGQP